MNKTPGTKRLSVICSAVAYVILGVPVWWATTSLHRPPLPHSEVAAVASHAQNRSALLPVALQLVLAVPTGMQLPPALSSGSFLQALQTAMSQSSDIKVQVQLSVRTNIAGHCSQDPPQSSTCSASATCEQQQQGPCPDLSSIPIIVSSASKQLQQQHVDDWLNTQAVRPLLQHLTLQATGAAATAAAAAPGHYTLFLLPAVPTADGSSTDRAQQAYSPLVVGRHRHAWLFYLPDQALQQPQRLLDAAAAAAVQMLSCCFALHSSPAALPAAESLPVSAAGHTQLSFSLLNADPSNGRHVTWDFDAFEQKYLTPIISSLAPVCHVSIESQVLHYTPAKTPGNWSAKHSAYVVKQSQLPFFIDSEWAVESGRAVMQHSPGSPAAVPLVASNASFARAAAELEAHVLHFLVYIPGPHRSPLLLLGPKGRLRDSNSFWIPSWGGVVVLNPPKETAAGKGSTRRSKASSSVDPSGGRSSNGSSRERLHGQRVLLQQEQYRYIASVVIAQLQALFGVAPSDSSSSFSDPSPAGAAGGALQLQQLPAGAAGFAAWQVDALLRQRAGYDVVEAARVLGSLSKLVQELPNLEMPELIGQQVQQALADIQQAWQYIEAGDYHAAGAAAGAARAAAEAAFLHPAVLAQLNFPESHKLGVYMPLFLPVSVPLLQGLATQVAHYISRRRQCRAG